MASSLAISAYYYAVYDTVEVHSTVIDDVGDPVAPADLASVRMELRKRDVILAATDDLDKFYSNSDFSFRSHFAHPPSVSNLEVRVVATSRDGLSVWERTAPVIRALVEPSQRDFADNAQSSLDVGTGISDIDEDT